MKDKYDKLMIQYGGSVPFSVLAKEHKKYKKITNKNKKDKNTKKKNLKRQNCNETSNSNSPDSLGFCSKRIPDGVMLKGKDGKIYRNKNKKWIKVN